MNMKEFEFVATRQKLIDRRIGISSTVRYDFIRDCEELGITPTIPRLLDWCDHWVQEYMRYTPADGDAGKPFTEWRPKR